MMIWPDDEPGRNPVRDALVVLFILLWSAVFAGLLMILMI